jgi:hypothetical protein
VCIYFQKLTAWKGPVLSEAGLSHTIRNMANTSLQEIKIERYMSLRKKLRVAHVVLYVMLRLRVVSDDLSVLCRYACTDMSLELHVRCRETQNNWLTTPCKLVLLKSRLPT